LEVKKIEKQNLLLNPKSTKHIVFWLLLKVYKWFNYSMR